MALRPIDWCAIQTVLILGTAVLLFFITSLFPVQSEVHERALMVDYSRQPPWPLWALTQASLAYFGGLYAALQPPLVRVNAALASGSAIAAMDAALKLRLSEVLENRAMTVAEIADARQVDAGRLEVLMQVLDDAGMFQRDAVDQSRWRNNALSVLLRDEHPNSVAASVQFAAASLETFGRLYETLLPVGVKAVKADEEPTVRESLLHALCSREKYASFALANDVNWKQYHRVITVGGCNRLAERVRASHVQVVTVSIMDTAGLISSSPASLAQSIADKAGELRWGDLLLVQSLSLLSDAQAEELIALFNELCKHSGARLMILDQMLVAVKASSAFLNARRRENAVPLMLQGGALRSTTFLDALLTKHNWAVDEVIETRSEFVGMLASSKQNQDRACSAADTL